MTNDLLYTIDYYQVVIHINHLHADHQYNIDKQIEIFDSTTITIS